MLKPISLSQENSLIPNESIVKVWLGQITDSDDYPITTKDIHLINSAIKWAEKILRSDFAEDLTAAYVASSEIELKACCEYLETRCVTKVFPSIIDDLRQARSRNYYDDNLMTKDTAISLVEKLKAGQLSSLHQADCEIILKALKNTENKNED